MCRNLHCMCLSIGSQHPTKHPLNTHLPPTQRSTQASSKTSIQLFSNSLTQALPRLYLGTTQHPSMQPPLHHTTPTTTPIPDITPAPIPTLSPHQCRHQPRHYLHTSLHTIPTTIPVVIHTPSTHYTSTALGIVCTKCDHDGSVAEPSLT